MATQHEKARETASFDSILTRISYFSSIGCRRATHKPMVPLHSPRNMLEALSSASTEWIDARINRARKIVLHPVIAVLVVVAIEGAGVFPVSATNRRKQWTRRWRWRRVPSLRMADWLHGHLYGKSCLTVVEDCEDERWRRRHWHSLRLRFITISLHLDLAINMLGWW